MSFNQNLQNNLQQWFQTTDDYKTFLTNIVSEEDARKIIDGYTAFIEEKKARSQAKIDGINNYDWILSRLQEKVPANEKITGMSLEEYATHISSQQTILFKDSIPQFEDNMFDVPNIPQIKDFFESAIDDPQDAPIHNIAGATLYEYSKTKGYSMEPTEAVILATNGINTAKILYHCATGKIDQLSGIQELENQAVSALTTIIKTTAPKVGETMGTAIGTAIGSLLGNAPVGGEIGKRVGRMAGEWVATKAKSIATTMKDVGKKVGTTVTKLWSWIRG